MRKGSASVSWIVLALALLCACSEAPSSNGRGILVIAVDALRYDHLGKSGYDRQTSPEFDRLAADGVFFDSAYAAAPRQLPAHVALLSGCDPRLARRELVPGLARSQASLWYLPADAPHPATRFLEQDIRTALFYDHPNLSPVYGCERGFELYDGPPDKDSTEPRFGSASVFLRFKRWLTQVPADRGWFAYLEIADLERVWSEDDPRYGTLFTPRPELSSVPPVGDAEHLFFAVPRSHRALGLRTLGEFEARYDGAIVRLDQAFKRLRIEMERQHRWENTTVVVVGAYGMSFGESGLLLDSGTFADVDLHVPLIVRPARGLWSDEVPTIVPLKGTRSAALVSTIDVLPTLLDIHHVPTKSELDGVSFQEALIVKEAPGRLELHASCAFQEGFATLSRTLCFERTWPDRVEDRHLSSSWFGDNAEDRTDVVREVLHDRVADPARGHLGPTGEIPSAGLELARDGEAWAERVERRRAALQAGQPRTPFTKLPDGR
ncbi:MAG TPA: sulfatase, partial [Planctomycetota bacterium]|nr:sulfatase [Planctomycetota bacterium]